MQSPWLVHLDQNGARFSENVPGEVSFTDARAEVIQAAQGTVAVPLTHLGLLRVSGEDAASFLHNLFSNDLKQLQGHHAQRSSFNSPKGRMLASFLIWRDGSDFILQLSADLTGAIQRKLSMYVLRSRAKVVDSSADLAVIGLAGPNVARVLDALGLVLPPEPMRVSGEQIRVVRIDAARVMLVVAPAASPDLWQRLMTAGAAPAGTAAWRWLDIQAGIPLITAPIQEEFVAQMINFEAIGGVSFQKGCYPGQEIVARTQYLGKLKKRLYRASIESDEPAPGTDVFSTDFGDQSAGKIVMSAPAATGSGTEVLVCLQTASRDSGDVHLGTVDGPALRFESLPYTVS